MQTEWIVGIGQKLEMNHHDLKIVLPIRRKHSNAQDIPFPDARASDNCSSHAISFTLFTNIYSPFMNTDTYYA